jgi:Uma2 family endonuclease
MNAATAPKRMTLEEFLALPDDGVERWLIRGELREKQDTDMTRRNKAHSITEANVTGLLWVWLGSRPEPRGAVVCGEAGIFLRRHPDTVSAGVDVAVITAAQADARDPDTNMIVGPPTLIAEVRSPNDTDEEISERVEEYLDCGVPLVWIISTHFRTVTVHRRGTPALALDSTGTLAGDPELPGFSSPVAAFFR